MTMTEPYDPLDYGNLARSITLSGTSVACKPFHHRLAKRQWLSNISRTMQPEHIPNENDEPGGYNSVSSPCPTSLEYPTREYRQSA